MGKKGKVNKLARMSDEERARYLQHRADMEEEARRRKRELVSRFIKNKLDKEEMFSRMNTAKINQGWRYILRKIKCKQMQQDIQGLKTSFNHLVERKDRQISSLLKALEDGDEQHRRAFQAHTEMISFFIGVCTDRLDKLQAEYVYQKNLLLENWGKEEADLTEAQEKAELQLKLIIHIQNRDFQNHQKLKESERAHYLDYLTLEHEEELRVYRTPKQQELDQLWKQLRDVYSSYLQHHKPMMAHYSSLLEKDEFYQRDIARNEAQIQQETEVLLNLQREWMHVTHTTAHKLRRMNRHKEELQKRYRQMQKEYKMENTRGMTYFEIMVNCSQDTIQHLERYKAKLDKIISLADICSKYETQTDLLTFKDLEIKEDQTDFENLDKDMMEVYKDYAKMDKFSFKVNRARVQMICLKNEKSKLLKENNQLKFYIKKYMTEMALRGGRDRPLSVKLQATMQKVETTGKLRNRPVTCIEGALSNAVLHEKRMKIFEQRNKDNEIRSYPRIQCWM